MTFIDNLYRMIREKGVTLKEMNEAVGISKNTVAYWKSTGSLPTQKILVKLCEYFECSPKELLSSDDQNAQVLSNAGVRFIPVFESVAAGYGGIVDARPIDRLPVFILSKEEAKDTIAVIVRGNSMQPKIEDGDTIVVRKANYLDSGSVGVVMVDGDEYLVKKICYGMNWVELRSLNPDYPPRRFEGRETSRVQILGQVKKVIKTI